MGPFVRWLLYVLFGWLPRWDLRSDIAYLERTGELRGTPKRLEP